MTPRSGDEAVFERPATRLHYWVTGPAGGPLVVLSHGAAMDHRTFEPQLGALRQFRVLTWDASGHGASRPQDPGFSIASAAADLLAILDELAAPTAVLVGQSMGGMISQEVLRRAPERVTGLAVIGASSTSLPLTAAERIFAPLTAPMLRTMSTGMLRRTIAKRSAVTPEAQAYALEAASQLTREEFLRVWPALIAGVRPDAAYRIDRPVLLLRGEHDTLGNIARQMPLWAERDPDSTYVTVPDAGHLANMDNPDRVNRELMQFLERVHG